MDPFEFMLAPHSLTNAEYNSWGSSVSYAKWLLEGLDYEEFNITRLMPSLNVQVHAQSLFHSFISFLFVITSNVGNCNKGDLLPVSQMILHISLGRFMPMARMALFRSVLCPATLMSWAVISFPTLEQ